MAGLPQIPFLLSIAGLSVTLAGFSGLVAAFRRGSAWRPMDAFRLRQIPEMGLAAALVALATFPLADTFGAATAVRLTSGLGLAFTFGHSLLLLVRSRRQKLDLSLRSLAGPIVTNLAILVAAGVGIVGGGATALEWLLVFLLGRPMLAFVLVLGEVAAD